MYDNSNPTTWFNGTEYSNLTWTQGRRLSSLKKGNQTYSYEYDMSGVRSVKIADGLKHEYVTQNGRVVRDTVTNAGTGAFQYMLDFTYDESGHPLTMRRYYNEAQTSYNTYHYVVNGQGFQGFNMFAYCGNRPTSFSDSKGTSPLDNHPINDNPYVAGGYSNRGFSVEYSIDFLDPYYCLEYAFEIVQVYGNGYSYREMDAERIAMEVYFHAKAFEAGQIMSTIEDAPGCYTKYMDTSLPSSCFYSAPLRSVGIYLIEKGNDIYVNNDESILRCFAYSSIWYRDTDRNRSYQMYRMYHPLPNNYTTVIRANSQERLSVS